MLTKTRWRLVAVAAVYVGTYTGSVATQGADICAKGAIRGKCETIFLVPPAMPTGTSGLVSGGKFGPVGAFEYWRRRRCCPRHSSSTPPQDCSCPTRVLDVRPSS